VNTILGMCGEKGVYSENGLTCTKRGGVRGEGEEAGTGGGQVEVQAERHMSLSQTNFAMWGPIFNSIGRRDQFWRERRK